MNLELYSKTVSREKKERGEKDREMVREREEEREREEIL